MEKIKLWNNKVLWTFILFFGASLLSCIKLIVMDKGGATTYFSLLIIWLFTFFFGVKTGFIYSVIFGFIKLFLTYITGEYINWEPMAIILEYPIACACFSVGGFLKSSEDYVNKEYISYKNVIQKDSKKLFFGYVIGFILQLIVFIASAMLYYPEERAGFFNNLVYSTVYELSYLLIEGIMTAILISIPFVADAIFFLKYIATHDKPEAKSLYF